MANIAAPPPVNDLRAVRRHLAGRRLSARQRQRVAELTRMEFANLRTMAEMHDAADREMRRARRRGIAVLDAGVVFPPIVSALERRSGTRARGAGRPAARSTRSSARSGDGGDDDPPGEPRAAALELQRHPQFGVITPNLQHLLEAARA